MKLSDFKFKLPPELIAQYPRYNRDDTRLMVVHRKSGLIEHKQMRDAAEYFGEGDLLVFNDAKVFPARLYSKKEKTLADIEVFLLRELNHELRYWDVLVDPARKIRIGNKLFFDEDSNIVAEVIDNTTSRGRTFRFLTDYNNDEFVPKLYAIGHTPLPKYIERPMSPEVEAEYRKEYMIQDDEDFRVVVEEEDRARYQSVFADKVGAVASPATSAQFSKLLIKRLELNGAMSKTLTSYMSLGNFKDVDVEDLSKHKTDSEHIIIPSSLVDDVDAAHDKNCRVCAVGTEVMRALEHVSGSTGQISAYDGWTNLFIFPPYNFSVANSMFANFYFPQSSQQMMVVAFGGYENITNAYRVAIQEGYRFGDFGDCMLIID